MNSLQFCKAPILNLNYLQKDKIIDIDEISNFINELKIDILNVDWESSTASRFQTGC